MGGRFSSSVLPCSHVLTVTSSSSSKPGWLSYESSAAIAAGCEAKPREGRREERHRGRDDDAAPSAIAVAAIAVVKLAPACGLSSRDAASQHRPLLLRRPILRIMVTGCCYRRRSGSIEGARGFCFFSSSPARRGAPEKKMKGKKKKKLNLLQFSVIYSAPKHDSTSQACASSDSEQRRSKETLAAR